MRNVAGMIKKAQGVKAQLQALNAELEKKHFSASAGDNCVTVTVTGSGAFHTLKIDKNLVKKSDIEILEDLICLATRNAQKSAKDEKAKLVKELTGGLNLPPDISLPF